MSHPFRGGSKRTWEIGLIIGLGMLVGGQRLAMVGLGAHQVCNTIVWGMCTYVFAIDALYLSLGLVVLGAGFVLFILSLVRRAGQRNLSPA